MISIVTVVKSGITGINYASGLYRPDLGPLSPLATTRVAEPLHLVQLSPHSFVTRRSTPTYSYQSRVSGGHSHTHVYRLRD